MINELEEKNVEIEQIKKEIENITRQKKIEIDILNNKIIQLQKDFDFEKKGFENKLKHCDQIFKKEKKKLNKKIDQLQSTIVHLKLKSSNHIINIDQLEVDFSKKIKLLTFKISEYEKMIKEHNIEVKKKKNQGFIKSLLNF